MYYVYSFEKIYFIASCIFNYDKIQNHCDWQWKLLLIPKLDKSCNMSLKVLFIGIMTLKISFKYFSLNFVRTEIKIFFIALFWLLFKFLENFSSCHLLRVFVSRDSLITDDCVNCFHFVGLSILLYSVNFYLFLVVYIL